MYEQTRTNSARGGDEEFIQLCVCKFQNFHGFSAYKGWVILDKLLNRKGFDLSKEKAKRKEKKGKI